MIDLLGERTLRLLAAPAEDLLSRELAFAIQIAWRAGAEAFEVIRLTLKGPSISEYPSARHYVETVVSIAEREQIISSDTLDDWRTTADSGMAMLDPRVRAFSASWYQRALLYNAVAASPVREVLARYKECAIDEIEVAGIGPEGYPLLSFGEAMYLVLLTAELEELNLPIIQSGPSDSPARLSTAADPLFGDVWRWCTPLGRRALDRAFGPYRILEIEPGQ